MSILITGGTGYIGSHVAISLLEKEHEVVLVDNFSNSSPKAIDRIKQIISVERMRKSVAGGETREAGIKQGHVLTKKLKFYDSDIRNTKNLEAVFSDNNIEAVIHLAGYKAVAESVREPLKYYQNNLESAMILLAVMKKYACNNLIFSSSATIYGDNPIPYREDMEIGSCSNPYGTSKAMIEKIFIDEAAANPDFYLIILRYFNPVGNHSSGRIGEDPKGMPNNLMPIILDVAMHRRDSLTVYGSDYPTEDGTCKRDYIHVVDLAEGHCKALEYLDIMNKKQPNTKDGTSAKPEESIICRENNMECNPANVEIFNLGTGKSYSVLEIINTFQESTGTNIDYEMGPRRPGDVPEVIADVTKAERLLGWRAEKDLATMCRDAKRWGENRGYF